MSSRHDDPKPSILPLSAGEDEPGKRAVKITIVGGQPPGNQRPMQPVPVGLEELMAMAAVSDEFSEALWDDRDGAVTASGVELTSTELSILGAVDDATLKRMVTSVGSGIPEQDRRGFLNMSAAAMLALVGGGSLAAGVAGCDRGTSKGIRPDHPGPTGARPDRPDPPDPEPKGSASESTGSEPEPETAKPDARPLPRPPTGARPDRPSPSRGVRPNRPPRKESPHPDYQGKTGSRPDRPDHFQGETGARPDKPPKREKPEKPKKPKKPPKQKPPRNYPNRGMSIQRPPVGSDED